VKKIDKDSESHSSQSVLVNKKPKRVIWIEGVVPLKTLGEVTRNKVVQLPPCASLYAWIISLFHPNSSLWVLLQLFLASSPHFQALSLNIGFPFMSHPTWLLTNQRFTTQLLFDLFFQNKI